MAKMGGQVAYDVIYSGKGVGEKKTSPCSQNRNSINMI